MESHGGGSPYRETVGYVKKILPWWSPAVAAAAVSPAVVPAVASRIASAFSRR